MVVYKYVLTLAPPNGARVYPVGEVLLNLPIGYKILSAGLDPNNNFCMWAMVDPDQPKFVPMTICTVGTGNGTVDPDARFIGTAKDGPFMWHVFELSQSKG